MSAKGSPSTPSTSPKNGAWNNTKATPNAWSSPSASTTNTSPNTAPKQGTTSYTLEYDQEDVTATTKRMLNLVVTTNDVADHSLREIETQNEKLKNQQGEVAEIHDSLNVSAVKLRGIKSFWGNLGNAFKKDKSQEHRKEREKYEKELAKSKLKAAEEKANKEDTMMREKVEVHQQEMKNYVATQQDSMKQAQVQSKSQVKAGTVGSDSVVTGKFVFEERKDPLHQCEAERDLDDIGDYVSQLKQKAMVMTDALGESCMRLNDLNSEMDRAHQRTQAVNKKADSILKS